MQTIRKHFEIELSKARKAIGLEDYETAWAALQRAHVLGQNYPLAHTRTHWNMLLLSWQQRDIKELIGQMAPTVLAIPLTLLFGHKRSLRTGRVNINNCEQTSIIKDLKDIRNQ